MSYSKYNYRHICELHAWERHLDIQWIRILDVVLAQHPEALQRHIDGIAVLARGTWPAVLAVVVDRTLLVAPFFGVRLLRAAAPHLRSKDPKVKAENRSIVNVSSTTGLHGNVGQVRLWLVFEFRICADALYRPTMLR